MMLGTGYMTADEAKACLGLTAKQGDNRTINKYVVEGKLEVKAFSKKVKIYRLPQEMTTSIKSTEEWVL